MYILPLSLGIARVTIVALLLTTSPATVSGGTTPSDDPLARAEFDKELSLDIKEIDVVGAFRLFARMTAVPFVIDFESDPNLRVTFKAQNMVCRGILASLASSYGLEFVSSEEGVVVRRRGFPPAAKKTTVGSWAPRPDLQVYLLRFIVRNPDGRTNFSGGFNVRKGVVGRVTVDAAGRGSVEVSPARGMAEPNYLGGVELRVSVQGERGGSLDLLTEFVTSRPLTSESYAEEHTVSKRRVTSGETLLARCPDGCQIVLAHWEKVLLSGGPEG